MARDGRIFAGASVWYGTQDVWIYDPATHAMLGARLKLSGYAREIRPGQLAVSGDGLRLVVLTDDPSIRFVTIAP